MAILKQSPVYHISMVMCLLFTLTFSGQWSTGQPVPIGSLAEDEDLTSPQIVADKADLFLAYATVPGYR